MKSRNFCGLGGVVDSHFDQVEIHFSHASVWPLLSMVNPIAWFAVLILICVGTVPDIFADPQIGSPLDVHTVVVIWRRDGWYSGVLD